MSNLSLALSVRELQAGDIGHIAAYWLDSDPDYLRGMGVDLDKLPSREGLSKMLMAQIAAPYEEKQSYALVWLIDGEPSGHCNVNSIVFGREAYMHLHMWQSPNRQKGLGTRLLEMSLPYFFQNLQLEVLYCEPYALNSAPHKILEKVGFEFVEEYVTVPGSLSFEQPVKRWRIDREAGLL